MTDELKEYDDVTKEWFFPENYKDWAFNSFKDGKDPAVECGIIMWMLTFRRPNTDKARRVWCDVPVQHLADTLHVRRSRVTDALRNLTELGVIKPDRFNDTAAMRHRPLVYRMMNKEHRWPTTPSSNSQVAEEIQRKVEAKTSRPSPAPSKAAPPQQPKTPIHSAPRSAPTSQAEWDAEMERRSAEKKKKQLAEEVELMKDPVYRAEKTKLLLKLGMTIEQIEARYGKAQGEK